MWPACPGALMLKEDAEKSKSGPSPHFLEWNIGRNYD
jgi:hypothetical protein